MSKTTKVKTEVREFEFHKSVFAAWRSETALKVKESIETDCKLWKLKKFIKDEADVSVRARSLIVWVQIEACQQVVVKHDRLLKEVFVSL